jgi:hypothetical protein
MTFSAEANDFIPLNEREKDISRKRSMFGVSPREAQPHTGSPFAYVFVERWTLSVCFDLSHFSPSVPLRERRVL